MRATEFFDNVTPSVLPPVLLFGPGSPAFGKEPFDSGVAEYALARVVEATVPPDGDDFAYAAFYADETPPGQIAQEAQTMPFLSERRVIVVRNAMRYSQMGADKHSPLTPLLRYLQNPADTTLLLLVASKADKRKAFYKACEKAGAVVDCAELPDRELERFARAKAEERGKAFDNGALGELLERAGGRLSDVTNALDLVANYVIDGDRIRAKDVRAACADVAEESVWALTDAIAASDTHQALATLGQLIEMGKSPDEIIGLVNWLLETAYKAAPDTDGSVKSSFQAKKVLPLVKKLGTKKLGDAMALCTRTHFLVRSTGVDPVLALELLVVKLAYAPKRRNARA